MSVLHWASEIAKRLDCFTQKNKKIFLYILPSQRISTAKNNHPALSSPSPPTPPPPLPWRN